MSQHQDTVSFQRLLDGGIRTTQGRVRGKESDKLPIKRGGKLDDRFIQVALILWHIRLRHIVGHIEQGLFVMLGGNGKRGTAIRLKSAASAIKREMMVYCQGNSHQNGADAGRHNMLLK